MINHVAKDIIQRFNCNKFVETGVFMGDSFLVCQDWFCELYPSFNTGPWSQGSRGKYCIYEIESNQKYITDYIEPRVQQQINVKVICSDSVEWLKNTIDRNEFLSTDSVFFYCDAHSHGSSNPEPLCDEIIQIKRLTNKPIISIDDWKVPHGNFDIYNTDMIKHLIKDRTDCVWYSRYHNFHGKWSIFVFCDRYSTELDEKLHGLPLVKEML